MLRALTLLLLLLSAGPAGAEPPVARLEAANRLLRAEYELARQPLVYFVFDLHGRKVEFRHRGAALVELAATEARLWGPPPEPKALALVKKDSLVAPQRVSLQIPPSEPAATAEKKEEPAKPEKKFELQALELDDMPASFHLLLDDGTRLTVRPVGDGFFSHLLAWGRKALWYLSRPLISVWHHWRGKTYTEVLVTLKAQDAQHLYWALAEGSRCLVVPPGLAELRE